MKPTILQIVSGLVIVAGALSALALLQKAPPPLVSITLSSPIGVSSARPTKVSPSVFYTNVYSAPVSIGIVSVESLINSARHAHGLPLLKDSTELDRVAQAKADHMVLLGYFDHTSPTALKISNYDEKTDTFHWIDGTVNTHTYVGENLGEGFADAQSQQQAWLNSPTHLANIIKPQYDSIGVGVSTGICMQQDTCKGDYGRQVIFAVTVFAN